MRTEDEQMTYLPTEERSRFVRSFNREPFRFDHRLHELDAFDVSKLIEVAKRLPTSYFSNHDASVSDGWNGETKASLVETMTDIARTNSLVLLKGLEDDAEYAPILTSVLRELEDIVGESLVNDASVWRATVIVSSPERITPYHIDGEANFLLQLRGEKLVNIFDSSDRTLLTDVELENFYAGDPSAARYDANRQAEAFAFSFGAGNGVHVPLHSPHWTRNGNDVSVAVSINCTLRSNEASARLYKFNRLMRKSGIAPAGPGVSAWRDRLKLAVIDGVMLAKRSSKRVRTPAKTHDPEKGRA